jgi:hypothetical protein
MADTSSVFTLYGLTALALAATLRYAVRHRSEPEIAAARAQARRFGGWVLARAFPIGACLLLAIFLISRTAFFTCYPVAGLAPDTATYASLANTLHHGGWPHFLERTPGYPVLIWLTTAVVDRWMAVVLMQCLLSLAAALFLVYAVSRLSRILALPATVAMGAFLGGSQSLIYDTTVLSDSFYASCIVFSAACLLLALTEGRPRDFSLASLSMALAILIRPAGMYFIVIYFLLIGYLLWHRWPRKALAAFALPFPVVLALLCAYNYGTLKEFVLSPAAETNLVGATVLYWAPDPSFTPAINRALADLPASLQRAGLSADDLATIRRSWNPAKLYDVFSRSYNFLVHREGWGTGKRFGSGDYLESRAQLRQVCLRAIRRHPDLYLKFVYANTVVFFEGIGYPFDFPSVLSARALQDFANTDRGFDLASAKEYRFGQPPAAVTITHSPAGPQALLASTVFGRMQIDWQFWHQRLFESRFWMWAYFVVFSLSVLQLGRHRGNHFGAFILFLLASIALGAAGVICLVEEALDRYSYPTQFIYYLAVTLCPLLWMKQRPGTPAPPA